MGCLMMIKSQLRRPSTLQVLSFQTAKAIVRLIALYSSLSDRNFATLLTETLKSPGVTYLNSDDNDNSDAYLLNLACSENLEELEALASSVSHLSRKCADWNLRQFDAVYSGLKSGAVVSLTTGSEQAERKAIKKLERWVSATSELHAALYSLSEMESSNHMTFRKLNSENDLRLSGYLEDKISRQRKVVNHYKALSLWSKTYDECVGPMGFVVFATFSRISRLFGGSSVPPLPRIINSNHVRVPHTRRFWRLRYGVSFESNAPKKRPPAQLSPPPGTVGGAGLALRYANLVLVAEEQLNSALGISDDARGYIYEQLTCSLKSKIRGKLRGGPAAAGEGHGLARRWREEVEGILAWLGPVAHDTVQWHAERNLEKQTFDARPNVMLLQTLYFSDLEKAEAAIVDLFVGLSYVYMYERRRRPSADEV